MIFKVGILIVLLLIIGQIEELRISLERLNKTIKNMNIKIDIQEAPKNDNKDPIVSTFKEK